MYVPLCSVLVVRGFHVFPSPDEKLFADTGTTRLVHPPLPCSLLYESPHTALLSTAHLSAKQQRRG